MSPVLAALPQDHRVRSVGKIGVYEIMLFSLQWRSEALQLLCGFMIPFTAHGVGQLAVFVTLSEIDERGKIFSQGILERGT